LESYLDWAGLRPLTELEYEKACRGPLQPVQGEFAWGTALIQNIPYIVSNINGPNAAIVSNYFTIGGNCWYASTAPTNDPNPLRAGIFAVPSYTGTTSARIQSGAGYYGAMELTGNAGEMYVCAPNDGATSSPFDGTPGTGTGNPPNSWLNSYLIVRGDQATQTSFRNGNRGTTATGLSAFSYNLYYTYYIGNTYTNSISVPDSSSFIGIRGGRTAP
jgi:hypothetical protein